ncbi:hypothetical protein Pmani_026897 [Petrolisthes manimaculis]|uniref:Uncharacterized protein n=1 Tax=Petrolisthes manimaculis TaxID=1843537 RepID=A0AAE1P2P7_9EUCA|nr:hypothetical protein Pmani_026897 [Petrolisthes manimaculis]
MRRRPITTISNTDSHINPARIEESATKRHRKPAQIAAHKSTNPVEGDPGIRIKSCLSSLSHISSSSADTRRMSGAEKDSPWEGASAWETGSGKPLTLGDSPQNDLYRRIPPENERKE